ATFSEVFHGSATSDTLEIFPSPFTEPLHHGYEAQISVFASRLADPVRFKSSGDVPAVGQPWSNTSTLCVGNDAFVDRLTLPQRRCLEASLCHRLLHLLVAASREPSPRAAALRFAAWKVSISLCYNQQTSRIGVCPGAVFDAEVLHADLSLLVPPRDDYSRDGRRLAPAAPRSQYNPAFEGLARFGNFLEQLGMHRDAAKVYRKKRERGGGIDACRESARAHGFAGDFEEARDACLSVLRPLCKKGFSSLSHFQVDDDTEGVLFELTCLYHRWLCAGKGDLHVYLVLCLMHQAGLRSPEGMSGVKDIVVHASPVIMLSMSEEQAARRLYDGIASTTRPFHKIIGVAFSPTAGAAGPRGTELEKSKLLACSCKLARYCSKNCQALHWQSHKALHKEAMQAKKRAVTNA
ncbi:hypothetical protein TeGR_g139, partial [Tetraparma gracilis]